MPNQNDRRVRKTRAQLRGGLEKLMQKKPMHSITVKELCEVCDINRGTFYLHYTDISALMDSVEQEMLLEFEAVLAKVTAKKPTMTGVGAELATAEIIAFLAQNAEMCRAILCQTGQENPLLERMKQIVRAQFAEEWRWPLGDDPRDPAGYAFAFVVEGCIGMLRHWLENDMPVPQAQMAEMLRIIPAQGVMVLAAHAQSIGEDKKE